MSSERVQVTVEIAPGFTRSTEEPAQGATHEALTTAIQVSLGRVIPVPPERPVPVRVTIGERTTAGSVPPGADEERLVHLARVLAQEFASEA